MKNLLFIILLFPLILFSQHGLLLQTGVPLTPAYEAEYQAVLDYATGQSIALPSVTNQGCQNAFVVTTKSNGHWSAFDALWGMAGSNSDFAKLNWKDPGNYSLVINGTVNYSSLDGFEKGGSANTDHIRTTFEPGNDCVNCSQNDFSIGGWFNINGTIPEDFVFYNYFGGSTAGVGNLYYSNRYVGAGIYQYLGINDQSPKFSPRTPAADGESIFLYRSDASTVNAQADDNAEFTESTSTSTGLPTHDTYIFTTNNSGTVMPGLQGMECGLFFIGEYTGNNSDYDDLHTAIQAYMDCIE